jgi:signal transduction histidine kinase
MSTYSGEPPDPLSAYPGLPRLELDQLLEQLIERAGDVLATQDRLRVLLEASRSIIGDLTLPVVLRRIVEAAVELVHARYGALGVLSEAGGLEQFIYVGIEADEAEAIGHLPEGKGLLGALIDDPKAIRLQRMADDPRSVGFPPNHPPMANFLGVPIRTRNSVFGNLYLTERDGGFFTAEDEDLVAALAATAGAAIENARLYEESNRRQRWLQASTLVTRQLLSVEGEDPLSLIARQTLEMADGDLASVVLPAPDGKRLMVEVAFGDGAELLTGMTYPIENSLVGLAFENGQPVLLGDVTADPNHYVHLSRAAVVGPVMVLPLIGTSRMRGALMVGRVKGRPRFDEADLDMATTFANHAALALELADARAGKEKMALLEDRDRIARDLHDHVIQRLYGGGLTLQSVASMIPDQMQVDRITRVIRDIDQTIQQIRTSIFQLRGSIGPETGAVRNRLLEVVGQAATSLGFDPGLRFTGPIDQVISDGVADDIVAVVREALSNAARHAQADKVAVTMAATKTSVTIDIADDGVGLPDTDRRSGLANLTRRAESYGGTLVVRSPDDSFGTAAKSRGTRLTWSIPLT